MIKFIISFIAVLTLFIFCNYKFSQAVRIIAYNEEEQPKEALYAAICMFISAFFWALYITKY
jgi:hypothetical protein